MMAGIPLADAEMRTAINQWLLGQLDTATESGGNEIAPGVYVESADEVDGDILVELSTGTTFSIELGEV